VYTTFLCCVTAEHYSLYYIFVLCDGNIIVYTTFLCYVTAEHYSQYYIFVLCDSGTL